MEGPITVRATFVVALRRSITSSEHKQIEKTRRETLSQADNGSARNSVNNLASEVTSFYCNNCLIPLDANNKNRTTTSKICFVLHHDDKQGPIFPGNKSVCEFRLAAKCQMQPSL